MLKTAFMLGFMLILLILSATQLPEDALLAMRTWIKNELEKQNVSDSDKVLTNIFRVDVQLTESQPPQIRLHVEGEHPDGCDYPVLVSQARRGNTVNVEVYREVPADVICPMILRPYRGAIELEGVYAPGNYTIKVNSHVQKLEI